MSYIYLTLLLSCLVTVILSSSVPLQQPYADPGQYYFGASNPAPCCRSDFPDEFGSCQVNEHCLQPTAPFCSAFGYCTQQKQYGYGGCVQCQYQRSPAPAPGYQ